MKRNLVQALSVAVIVSLMFWASTRADISNPPASVSVPVSAANGGFGVDASGFPDNGLVRMLSGSATSGVLFGANPTISTTSNIGIDSTDDQFLYWGHGSGTARVVPYDTVECKTLVNASGTDDNVAIWTPPDNITVTQVICKTFGLSTGTQPVVALHDDSGNALSSPVCGNTTGTTAFTNATTGQAFTQGEGLQVDVTNSPSPTPTGGQSTYTNICWKYTVDRQ